jgi:hypothetical protein
VDCPVATPLAFSIIVVAGIFSFNQAVSPVGSIIASSPDKAQDYVKSQSKPTSQLRLRFIRSLDTHFNHSLLQ